MNVHFFSGDFIYDDLFDIFVLRHMTWSNELWTNSKKNDVDKLGREKTQPEY